MFIKSSQRGYGRNGEQFARGSFLCVFSHNQYKWEDENNTPHAELHGQSIPVIDGDGFTLNRICDCNEETYSLKHCPAHASEYKRMPAELSRKLYACVRHVSLRQCGHWMMGTARIAGQSVTVSGSYGCDGLPMDYEKLTAAARAQLVEVPANLAETFWAGGGHNEAGNEAPAMRDWALATFRSKAA